MHYACLWYLITFMGYFLMNFMLWLLLPLVMFRIYIPAGGSRTSTQLPSACFTKLPAML